jgi:hypothetical protein
MTLRISRLSPPQNILTRAGERANHKRRLELVEDVRAPSKAKSYHQEEDGHAKNI